MTINGSLVEKRKDRSARGKRCAKKGFHPLMGRSPYRLTGGRRDGMNGRSEEGGGDLK